MTIRNMTIILNILKYDNLQYDNYFEKIVIFEFENMTKKNLWRGVGKSDVMMTWGGIGFFFSYFQIQI